MGRRIHGVASDYDQGGSLEQSDLPVSSPCDLNSELQDELDEFEEEIDSYLTVGEAEAFVTEVVYVRDHVCVWPTKARRIPGRLSLIKQHCVLFMSWLPYGQGVLHEDGSFEAASSSAGTATADHTLYAVHPIPLSEVRLLRAHLPLMGPHRLDVTLVDGLTLAPLHLPAQAVHAFVQVIRQHVPLVRSSTSRHTWLINDVADPLQRSLTALDIGDVLLGGPPRAALATTHSTPASTTSTASTSSASQASSGSTLTASVAAEGSAGGAAGERAGKGSAGVGVGVGAGVGVGPAGYKTTSLTSAVTWAPPAPPPAPPHKPPALSNTWASWVTNADTVWDVYSASGTADASQQLPRPLSPADAAQLSGAGRGGLVGVGHAAWRAISSGLARLVAEYVPTGFDEEDEEEEEEDDGEAEEGGKAAQQVGQAGVKGGKVAGGGEGGVVVEGMVSWQAADGVLGSGRHAANAVAACLAVGTLVHCDTVPAAAASAAPAAAAGGGGGGGAALVAKHTAAGKGKGKGKGKVAGGGGERVASPGSPAPSRESLDEEYEMVERTIQTWQEAHLRAPILPPLSLEDLEAMQDSEGRLGSLQRLRERCWQSGLEPAARRVAWPWLLGLRAPHHTEADHRANVAARRRAYAELCQQWQARIRDQPPSHDRHWWESCSRIDKDVGRTDRAHPAFAAEGCAAAKALRRLLLCYITQHPISSAAHRAVCHPASPSSIATATTTSPSNKQQQQPSSSAAAQVPVSPGAKTVSASSPRGAGGKKRGVAGTQPAQQQQQAEEEEPRCYSQGMSDLAAPLLVVLADESEAFAAFCALMARVGGNFDVDQRGMHAQLEALKRLVQLLDPPLHAHLESIDCLSYFFTFRWLLILFKREFKYEDVLRLWEALWSTPLTPHMHLYLAAAVLVHHRRALLSKVQSFDGMLKFCIQLAGTLELQPLLGLAQALATYVGAAADDVLLPLSVTCWDPSSSSSSSGGSGGGGGGGGGAGGGVSGDVAGARGSGGAASSSTASSKAGQSPVRAGEPQGSSPVKA